MRNVSRNGRRPAELEALQRGGKIAKERRIELGLTLEELAKETALSTSFLSRLENGKLGSVTVVDLMRVARALDTPVVAFFLDELSERILVTRADQRRRVVRNISEAGEVTQQLLVGARNVKMEAAIFEVPPRGDSGSEITHDGEEFVTVLSGALTFFIGDRLRYDLEEGDTIYYPATLPHRWENPTRKRVRFLGVCTPPGY